MLQNNPSKITTVPNTPNSYITECTNVHTEYARRHYELVDDATDAASVAAVAAYTGLGMTDPSAEQCAEAGWHPRVDGPASSQHRSPHPLYLRAGGWPGAVRLVGWLVWNRTQGPLTRAPPRDRNDAVSRRLALAFVCLSKGPAPAAATALSHAASLRHPARARDLLEPPLALDR